MDDVFENLSPVVKSIVEILTALRDTRLKVAECFDDEIKEIKKERCHVKN